MANPATESTLTMEERELGLSVEHANICRRLGVAPSAMVKSMIAAIERNPGSDPESAQIILAARMSGIDATKVVRLSFVGGRPRLMLREGALKEVRR